MFHGRDDSRGKCAHSHTAELKPMLLWFDLRFNFRLAALADTGPKTQVKTQQSCCSPVVVTKGHCDNNLKGQFV